MLTAISFCINGVSIKCGYAERVKLNADDAHRPTGWPKQRICILSLSQVLLGLDDVMFVAAKFCHS